jgi:hypothetical protein
MKVSAGAAALVLVVAIVAGFWYFTVYDTAAGKCDRGDIQACAVVASRQTPTPEPTTAPVALKSQSGGGAFVMLPNCQWSLPGHDAFVLGWTQDGGPCAEIGAYLPAEFKAQPSVTSTIPPSNTEMDTQCTIAGPTWSATVVDVIGAAGFGTDACEGFPNPTWH